MEKIIEEKQYQRTDFTKEPLENAIYDNCKFTGCNFLEAYLSEFTFLECRLENCDLSDSSLQYSDLQGTDFQQSVLKGADLRNAVRNTIQPEENNIKGAKFSADSIEGLL